jgi:C-terminal processing protease CtpA/Prc
MVSIIRFVIENSPVTESGILKGDKIIILNGKDVRAYEYKEVFDLLRKESQEVQITLERKKDRFTKSLKLRHLI